MGKKREKQQNLLNHLRRSRFELIGGDLYKSCPECSGKAGEFVYKPYPDAFGKRAPGGDPDNTIPQSWCAQCRGPSRPDNLEEATEQVA